MSKVKVLKISEIFKSGKCRKIKTAYIESKEMGKVKAFKVSEIFKSRSAVS